MPMSIPPLVPEKPAFMLHFIFPRDGMVHLGRVGKTIVVLLLTPEAVPPPRQPVAKFHPVKSTLARWRIRIGSSISESKLPCYYSTISQDHGQIDRLMIVETCYNRKEQVTESLSLHQFRLYKTSHITSPTLNLVFTL